MSGANGGSIGKVKSLDVSALPTVPKQWRWARLCELAANEPNAITDGPFGSNLKTSHYTATGPRVIRLQNIGDGVFVDEYAHISESHFRALKKHEVVAGDLAIAALGESLPRACVIPSRIGPAIVKADCPRFRPNSDIVLSEFVNFALNSPDTRRRTSTIIHGVGRPRLNLAEVRGIWLPVAPLDEQRRVVAKIEELFSDLDAGVAALERAKANLNRYRAAVLKAAVEGKLTEQWRAEHPNTEPASKLLERILAERRKKWEAAQLAKFTAAGKQSPKNWREKYVEPTQPETTLLKSLPEGWCWASVDQLSFVVRGSSPRPAGDPRYFGGPIPWITVGSLTADDQPYLRSVAEGLTDAGKDVSRWIEADTLLLTNSGATLGVPKITLIAGCINDGSVALLNVDYPLKLYLYYILKSQTDRLRTINQGAAQPNLNTGIVKSIAIPLCSVAEQEQIIAALDQRLTQIDAATVALGHGLLRAARLRQSILKQAFEGKLVSQDPTDEPASALLERVRATSQLRNPSRNGDNARIEKPRTKQSSLR